MKPHSNKRPDPGLLQATLQWKEPGSREDALVLRLGGREAHTMSLEHLTPGSEDVLTSAHHDGRMAPGRAPDGQSWDKPANKIKWGCS